MKKKFRCWVCGYVYEGENPPAECPQCHAPASKFVEIKDEARHGAGFYGLYTRFFGKK